MDKFIDITFLEKIPRPKTENKFLSGLALALFLILLPLLLVIGLLIFLLILLPISLWQKITMSKEEREEEKQNKIREDLIKNQWGFFYENQKIKIEQQLAGSLPQNSGDYLRLRSSPPISYLNNKIFGDWFLVQFNGVFLQRWNNEQDIICDLVFIDFDQLAVNLIKTGIHTKEWQTDKISEAEVKFKFISENEEEIYLVRNKEMLKSD